MAEKILIQIEGRQFELDLNTFCSLAQEEILELFQDKNLSVFDLLKISLENIQKRYYQDEKIKDLIDKISLCVVKS